MHTEQHERGQSLVVVAVALLGLVALTALIIDGGSIYLNRRNAQTAADAAALAGAREQCVNHGDLVAVQNMVNQYAITENGATAVDSVTVDDAKHSVDVVTRVETPSFFARIFGFAEDAARAEAAAGCFVPAAENLLPITWACQPPVGGSVEECTIHSIPWRLFKDEIWPRYRLQLGEGGNLVLDVGDEVNYATYVDGSPINGKIPYIVMDAGNDMSIVCAPPIGSGTVNCDFNGDGIPDLTGGGDRGWLALDGGGASSLVNLIVNGYAGALPLPQWFPNQTGVANDVFIKAKATIEGQLVLVPVFNAYCLDATAATVPTNCVDYQPGDYISTISNPGAWFRIAGFVPFFVTCISAHPNQTCPVKTLSGLDPNVSTIEGYFISGYVEDTEIGPGGMDLGIYIISLIK